MIRERYPPKPQFHKRKIFVQLTPPKLFFKIAPERFGNLLKNLECYKIIMENIFLDKLISTSNREFCKGSVSFPIIYQKDICLLKVINENRL